VRRRGNELPHYQTFVEVELNISISPADQAILRINKKIKVK
jgi:hypothetical protein